MGVDASYLYGYGADVNEIEWDVEYLKEKYKDILDEKINPKYDWKPTWREFLQNLESAISSDEDDEDYEEYELSEILSEIDFLFDINYDDERYLTFDHKHIAKLYPEAKLKDLDAVAKLYAKELGIKNVEIIKWIEWGYFS